MDIIENMYLRVLFQFTHPEPQVIVGIIWLLIVVVALFRYIEFSFFTRVSWKWLVVVAVVLRIGYGATLTWLQYAQWESSSFTQTFLTQPLSKEAPLPLLLEWVRPSLEQPLGYFIFYVFGRFWINIIIILGLAGFFAALLKLRAYYRPWNFKEGEILAITLSLLVSGWPGVIVLLPLAFIFAIIFSVISSTFYGVSRIYLTPAFLVAAPVALLYGAAILKFVGLYALLKI